MKGRIIVHNARNSAVRLRIEPWADEYDIAPDQRRTILAEGPDPVELLITVEPESLAVWGWAGSILDLDAEPDSN